jgi:hypothetical protein
MVVFLALKERIFCFFTKFRLSDTVQIPCSFMAYVTFTAVFINNNYY